jgi:hypothetical protein
VGPIYFVCHDAPVILYQSDSLEKFLTELFRMFEPPHESLIDDVHEDRPARVWKTNPGVLSYERCLRSEDPILSAFARARRHVSNSRPAQREARRGLFLGTLRPEYPDQAFSYARRLRLPEAEEHHLPAPRTRGLIGLFAILFG